MQSHLVELLLELLDAELRSGTANNADKLEELVRGSVGGGLLPDEETAFRDRVVWVNAAYFGRGESGIPLIERGLLRADFPRDFQREVDKLIGRK